MPYESNSQSRVLLFGGAGFIGSRLVQRLLAEQRSVVIGDLVQSKCHPELSVICDVRNSSTLTGLVQGDTAIVNLAAEHRDDVRPVTRYHETNVEGARNVCATARLAGVSKIVFTSSVAVYGFHPGPVDEDAQLAPFNPYGETKMHAEEVYKAWAREDSSRTLVIVRPTVVFGEGNRGNVFNLLKQIASGRFVMVGSGTNFKSMAYVENVADFLVHALSLPPGIHTFNYVDGPDLNMNCLVEEVRTYMNRAKRAGFRIPKWLGLGTGHCLDALSWVTNRSFPVSAIRIKKFCESTQFKADRAALTGFRPLFSLQEGLERTIEFEFLRPTRASQVSEVPIPSSPS